MADPASGHEIFVVRITAVEIAAALFRRAKGGSLDPTAASAAVAALERDLTQTFGVVEFTPAVSQLAIVLAQRHALRGYDCVQLAAALRLQQARNAARLSPLELISADLELNSVAQVEALSVSDPNDHA